MKKIGVTAVFAIISVTSSAQLRSGGINLSLWKNICTQRQDSAQRTFLNIGLISHNYRHGGLGVNVLGEVVQTRMGGVQLSGLSNLVGAGMKGVQFAGISNMNGNNLSGVSVSGLVNIAGNNAKGLVASGATNITGSGMGGIMISGLTNLTGEHASGIMLSGAANIARADYQGVMLSGLLNVSGESMKGVQAAGLFNIAGTQLSGMQIGAFNVAVEGKGLQLGLVNYYQKSMKGVQLGLVNANPDTRVQMMVSGGNSSKLNVGARFKNDLFYTVIGAGMPYLDFSDKFSGCLFYRAGLSFPLFRRLSVNGDLGYQHVETFKNKHSGVPAHLCSLQARAGLEYQITSKFGIFVSGGYEECRTYNRWNRFRNGAIWEAGIILF